MNIAILKNSIILLLSQNIQFYLHFITNRFNSHEKDTQKRKKMTLYYSDSELHEEYLKIILMNARLFQMLKEESWVTDMILLSFS